MASPALSNFMAQVASSFLRAPPTNTNLAAAGARTFSELVQQFSRAAECGGRLDAAVGSDGLSCNELLKQIIESDEFSGKEFIRAADLSNLISSAARLGFSAAARSGCEERTKFWRKAVARTFHVLNSDQQNDLDIGTVCCSLVQAKLPIGEYLLMSNDHGDIFADVLVERAKSQSGRLSPQELSSVLWSFSKLRLPRSQPSGSYDPMSKLYKQAYELSDELTPSQVSNILWAAASCSHNAAHGPCGSSPS